MKTGNSHISTAWDKIHDMYIFVCNMRRKLFVMEYFFILCFRVDILKDLFLERFFFHFIISRKDFFFILFYFFCWHADSKNLRGGNDISNVIKFFSQFLPNESTTEIMHCIFFLFKAGITCVSKCN